MLFKKIASLWDIYFRMLLIGALVLALVFRLGNLDVKPYWGDEVLTSIRVSGYKLGTTAYEIRNRIMPVEELFQYRDINSGRSWPDTSNALISQPEHTPLYFVLARLWSEIFGSSVGAMRALPALISLLTLPLFYWMSLLLFESAETATVTLCLACVSPILIRQAQEARSYSLWMVGVLASSALLLSALRSNKRSTWTLYGGAVALTFLTHLLSALVFIVHGIYVFLLYRDKKIGPSASASTRLNATGLESVKLESTADRSRIQQFRRFFWIGMIPVLPWLALVISQFRSVQSVTSWQNQILSSQEMITLWTLNVSQLAFFWMPPERWPIFAVLLFLLIAFCVYRLLLQSHLRQWLLPVLFCVFPSVLFIASDVLFGGIRSAVSRYFIPTYLGTIFVLGFGLGFSHFRPQEPLRRREYKWGRRILFHAIFVTMIVASWQNLQSPVWWKDYKITLLETSQVVMRSPTPAMLVSDHHLGEVLSVAFLLRPTDRVLWLYSENAGATKVDIDKIFDSSEFFLYAPSENLLNQVEAGLEERQLTIESTEVENVFQIKRAIALIENSAVESSAVKCSAVDY